MPIGENIRTLREGKRLSQDELAALSKMTGGYISKIERGVVTPSVEKIKKLVIALETSADKLIFDENENDVSSELKHLFRKASELDEREKMIIKEVLIAFIAQATAEKMKR